MLPGRYRNARTIPKPPSPELLCPLRKESGLAIARRRDDGDHWLVGAHEAVYEGGPRHQPLARYRDARAGGRAPAGIAKRWVDRGSPPQARCPARSICRGYAWTKTVA